MEIFVLLPLCNHLCTWMRTRVRANCHRSTVEYFDIETESVNHLDASEIHSVTVFGVPVVRINPASLAKKVVNHAVVPAVVAEIRQIRMRLEISGRNVLRRHHRTLTCANRTVAADASFDLLTPEREANPPAMAPGCVIPFMHSISAFLGFFFWAPSQGPALGHFDTLARHPELTFTQSIGLWMSQVTQSSALMGYLCQVSKTASMLCPSGSRTKQAK